MTRRRALSSLALTILSSATSSAEGRNSTPRARSTTSPTSAVNASSSSMMSLRRLSRSACGRRSASSSVWMFARRLAIGVRSSCEASATRLR